MTPFILLGHQRSGSFLLLYALNQHPRVHGFAEVLFPKERPRREQFKLDDGRWLRDGEDGATFLRDALFRPRGERDVIGFKLFYDHAPAGPAESAWSYLAGLRDLRVIHLYRERLLDSLVSLRVAQITDDWMVGREERRAPVELAPFDLTPEECRRHFDAILDDRGRALARLAGLPILELEYEALCERFAESTDACFRHLGVAPRPVEKELVKQATRPVREQIKNYPELARAFAGTRYARYF